MTDTQRLLNFAKDLATDYDHDHEEHTRERRDYGGACRVCLAVMVIREVLGENADSLLRGPYYGTPPEIVATLVTLGCPTDHLTESPA